MKNNLMFKSKALEVFADVISGIETDIHYEEKAIASYGESFQREVKIAVLTTIRNYLDCKADQCDFINKMCEKANEFYTQRMSEESEPEETTPEAAEDIQE